jgi:hypothetical protein
MKANATNLHAGPESADPSRNVNAPLTIWDESGIAIGQTPAPEEERDHDAHLEEEDSARRPTQGGYKGSTG